MINYTDLKDYLLTTARRHPDLQFCEFDSPNESINDPDIMFPAFVITPSSVRLIDNTGVLTYSFDLLYMDKMRQEKSEEDKVKILESGFQFLIGYLQVIDITYKVITGALLEPQEGQEDAYLVGVKTSIEIEDQYNLDKFMSPFYE